MHLLSTFACIFYSYLFRFRSNVGMSSFYRFTATEVFFNLNHQQQQQPLTHWRDFSGLKWNLLLPPTKWAVQPQTNTAICPNRVCQTSHTASMGRDKAGHLTSGSLNSSEPAPASGAKLTNQLIGRVTNNVEMVLAAACFARLLISTTAKIKGCTSPANTVHLKSLHTKESLLDVLT